MGKYLPIKRQQVVKGPATLSTIEKSQWDTPASPSTRGPTSEWEHQLQNRGRQRSTSEKTGLYPPFANKLFWKVSQTTDLLFYPAAPWIKMKRKSELLPLAFVGIYLFVILLYYTMSLLDIFSSSSLILQKICKTSVSYCKIMRFKALEFLPEAAYIDHKLVYHHCFSFAKHINNNQQASKQIKKSINPK